MLLDDGDHQPWHSAEQMNFAWKVLYMGADSQVEKNFKDNILIHNALNTFGASWSTNFSWQPSQLSCKKSLIMKRCQQRETPEIPQYKQFQSIPSNKKTTLTWTHENRIGKYVSDCYVNFIFFPWCSGFIMCLKFYQ